MPVNNKIELNCLFGINSSIQYLERIGNIRSKAATKNAHKRSKANNFKCGL